VKLLYFFVLELLHCEAALLKNEVSSSVEWRCSCCLAAGCALLLLLLLVLVLLLLLSNFLSEV